jgi:hypothetical protein
MFRLVNKPVNIRIFSFGLVTLLGLAVLLSACAGGAPAATPVVSHGGEVEDLVSLIDALRAAGAEVEPAGEVEQPFFEPVGQLIRVNGVDVQVFEFADQETRLAAQAEISPDGSSVGTNMITWIDTPHFWGQGRLIVLYVGSDAGLATLLTSALGAEAAPAE